MRRHSIGLVMVIIALLVGAIGLPVASASQGPSPQSVTVTNTAANPVPVAGTVNVGNLPATQPVSGTVNVGNLPATQPVSGAVAISGTPTVSVQRPELYHVSRVLVSSTFYQTTIDAPAGEQMVVQSISILSRNAAVSACGWAQFYIPSGYLFNLPLNNVNSQCSASVTGDPVFWSEVSQMRVLIGGISSTGDPEVVLTVSGYLLP